MPKLQKHDVEPHQKRSRKMKKLTMTELDLHIQTTPAKELIKELFILLRDQKD